MDTEEGSGRVLTGSHFCPKCGHEVGQDDSFCRSCGADIRTKGSLDKEQPAQAVPAERPSSPPRQDNSMAIAGAAVFFMGFLVCLWMIPLGLPLLAGGLGLWIVGAARRNRV